MISPTCEVDMTVLTFAHWAVTVCIHTSLKAEVTKPRSTVSNVCLAADICLTEGTGVTN